MGIVVDNNSSSVDMKISHSWASSEMEPKLSANDKSDTVMCYVGDEIHVGPAAFSRLEEDGETGFFAQDFKMKLDVARRRAEEGGDISLNDTKITMISLDQTETKEAPLMKTIADYLRVVGNIGFDKLVDDAKKQNLSVPAKKDVTWVVTVPAIWTDQARIAMRQAMIDAELVPSGDKWTSKIRVCLEPEGAVLQSFSDYLATHPDAELKGKKLLVIDLGGGTADITSHVVSTFAPSINRIELEELCAPTGGDWGGRLWNQEFDKCVMKDILTAEDFQTYQPESVLFHYDKMNRIKNNLSGTDLARKHRIEISWAIKPDAADILKRRFSHLPESTHINFIQKKGKSPVLLLPEAVLCELFNVILDPLKNCLSSLTRDNSYDFAFLVGGLGSNLYIRNQLTTFMDMQNQSMVVYSPVEAGMAIVRGAVRFGFDSSAFGSRKARVNYGIGCWNPENHSEPLFDLLIAKNANLMDVQRKSAADPFEYYPVNADQRQVSLLLYECDIVPSYISDPKCMFITSIVVDFDMEQPFDSRAITIAISMSDTVIKGIVRQSSNGTEWPLKWSSR